MEGIQAQRTIFTFLFLFFSSVSCKDESTESRSRRTVGGPPKLEMTVLYGDNVTEIMESGCTYMYKATLRHSPGEKSKGDAKGLRVLWMLAPFVKYDTMLSVTGTSQHQPRTQLKDNTLIFEIAQLNWGYDISFSFRVKFNEDNDLKPAKHHVVSNVQLTYYDSYSVDAAGAVTKGTFFSEPMQTLHFFTEIPGCTLPLGMKSKAIKDYQLSASSSYSDLQPSKAREISADAWCAQRIAAGQYLQIDFMQKTHVTGLTTYGRNSPKYHWTKKYYILYSNDDINWLNYTLNGYDKTFIGNTDRLTPKTHWLEKPFYATNIRIVALEWNKLICLRLELFGCTVPGSPVKCISPIGMENGDIPDEAITTSVPASYMGGAIKAVNARLNKPVLGYPAGWAARAEVSDDYLQIDFGSMWQVTRVAVQGGYGEPVFYASEYQLRYSLTSIDWQKYTENGAVKSIDGPKDERAAKYPLMYKLKNPFVTRYLRIYPTKWAIMPIMRAEVYGCFQEPLSPYTDDADYLRRSFLLDPVTDHFFICMYSADRDESSCFVSKDHKEWRFIEPSIISILGANTRDHEFYGFDRKLNLLRSRDLGQTWYQISTEYLAQRRKERTFYKASTIPENCVHALPNVNTTLTTSTGDAWGVSSNFIHFKIAGTADWTTVGSWKCCGL